MARSLIHTVAILLTIAAHAESHAAYNTIGGNGGKRHNLQCPSGRYAVGIGVRHDESTVFKPATIIQIRLRCVAVDPDTGDWSGTPAWTGWSPTDRLEGTQGLEYDSTSCPDNEFISESIFGNTTKVGFATVVGQLDWRCVRFDQIDRSRGTSRRTLGIGEFGVGVTITTETERQQSRVVASSDSAMNMLYLKYGLALDSVRIGVRHMPWTEALRRPAPNVGARRARMIVRRPPAPAGQPDLSARLTSVLWRYSGQTRFRGATYRKVHHSFCATGMIRRGSYSTRHFYLPSLSLRVRNTGSGSAAGNFDVQSTFGNAGRRFSAGSLQPGQSRTFRIARPDRIRRCVTLGRVPGGCHECAGQSAYEDPRLEVRVDTANAVSESNETNNRLVR